MKKFLAVLVVFTLIAGVAFAEMNLGGQFGYQAVIAHGNSADGTDVMSAAKNRAKSLNVSFKGDTWGGMFRILGNTSGVQGDAYWGNSPFGFAWWKPIDQFKLQIGCNPDGDWGAGAITGWGFLGEAQDYTALDNWIKWDILNNLPEPYKGAKDGLTDLFAFARGTGFYGGYSATGVALSIYPADGVSIGIGLPLAGADGKNDNFAAPLYKSMAYFHFNAAVKIGDVGKLNLSFKGGEGLMENLKGDGNEKSPGNIYASFYLTQIENLGVDIGVDFPLPYTAKVGTTEATAVDSVKIGLGVKYESGDFGVKFRAGIGLPGSFDGDSDKQSMLSFNVLPYIKLLDGKMTAYLNAGLSLALDGENDDSNATSWYVNPYVKVPAGGINFYAGFQLYGFAFGDKLAATTPGTDGPFKDKNITLWAIPIGLQLYF